MPSHLRIQSSFEPVSANVTYQTSPILPATKKQKMSLTQTYYVASTARSKLGREASRPDHNLRLLVGHANLLDTLMVELADAEREQEAWFNQTVKKATKSEEPRHIQWIDAIPEVEDEESDDDSDMESDDGSDIYDEELFDLPLVKIRSPPIQITSAELAEESDEEYDEDEDEEELALTRVASKHSPPELLLDSDSESEDDSMPSSPEESNFELDSKQETIITTANFYDMKDVIMQRQQQQQPIIAAC